MLFLIDGTNAQPLRLPAGKQVTIANFDIVNDIFFDYQAEPLNAATLPVSGAGGNNIQSMRLPKATAAGVLAVGGSFQFFPFPGIIWVRAAAPTQLTVFEG